MPFPPPPQATCPSANHWANLGQVSRRATSSGSSASGALQDEASAAADANPDQADEEWSAREPERRRIEAALAAERSTNMRDLAIKVLVNSGEGTSPPDRWLTLECAALAGRAVDKLPSFLFTGDACG